jgi:tripartite-type tricarboxylate transporter receptor subunit TctC
LKTRTHNHKKFGRNTHDKEENVITRRFMIAAAAFLLSPLAASAQWSPTQPIRWIVPYPAGGGTDFMARALAVHLEKSLGQPIVVENKPGASTVTGTVTLTQAAPDGHTVGMLFDSLAINAALGMSIPAWCR